MEKKYQGHWAETGNKPVVYGSCDLLATKDDHVVVGGMRGCQMARPGLWASWRRAVLWSGRVSTSGTGSGGTGGWL
jgi:hypothetical protein